MDVQTAIAQSKTVPAAAVRNLMERRTRSASAPATILAIVLTASVFQLYIFNFSDIYISVYIVSTLLVAAVVFTGGGSLLRPSSYAFLAIMVVFSVSIIWSPAKMLAIRNIVYALPILSIYLLARLVATHDERRVINALKIYTACACLEAFACILFRIKPDVEAAFYGSGIAGPLINSKVAAGLMGLSGNNVLDPEKAGGFAVNGNTAAVWCAVNACVALAVAARSRKPALWIFALVLNITAIVATGSKAGLILATLIPLFGFALWRFGARRLTASDVMIALVTAFLLGGALVIVQSKLQETELANASISTLQSREVIWGRVGEAFQKSPVLGLGFGGWEQNYMLGSNARNLGRALYNMPLHNWVLILWAQAGVAAVLGGLSFAILIYRELFRSFRNADRTVVTAALMAWTWLLIHGMGENFGLFGDVHFQAPLAALLGLTSAQSIRAAKI